MMIVHNVSQGSPEWHRVRLGVPTASNFHKIITPKTMQLSAQSVRYIYWLLAEWILGEPLESPEMQWMQRGIALEDQAVRSYCFERNCQVQKVGFVTLDDGTAGCSPDRLIIAATRGGLEIKCPSPQVHVGNMLTRAIDDDHKAQAQGQMWIAELDWLDVESYCPDLPTVIIRANRDEQFIAALKSAVQAFVETMLECRFRLAREYGPFLREQTKIDEQTAAKNQEAFDSIFNKQAAARNKQIFDAIFDQLGARGQTFDSIDEDTWRF